jgi:hypothetical protein
VSRTEKLAIVLAIVAMALIADATYDTDLVDYVLWFFVGCGIFLTAKNINKPTNIR